MSFTELLEKLRNTEETILLELMDINSEQLVDAFYDVIKDNENRLRQYFFEEEI